MRDLCLSERVRLVTTVGIAPLFYLDRFIPARHGSLDNQRYDDGRPQARVSLPRIVRPPDPEPNQGRVWATPPSAGPVRPSGRALATLPGRS
jgi:hypothetical protein